MNILGHAYVAFKVTGRLNKYLVAGSHVPDLVPFVPDSVFSFEEIHESGDKFLKFLEEKHPYARDLALGMMVHSVKYGADKFNRAIEEWLLADNEESRSELAREIVDCSGVNLEVARKGRIHNYLWAGIDFYLLKKQRQFVGDLAETHRLINREEIASLLAEGFRKEEKEVKRMVDYLLKPTRPELLTSLEGLVEIWKKFLAVLPEKDAVNETKTIWLFGKIYLLFENQWEKILLEVVTDVKKRLGSFL